MRCVYRGDLVCLIRSLNPFYEQVLEDIALTVQNQLEAKLPFCAKSGLHSNGFLPNLLAVALADTSRW